MAVTKIPTAGVNLTDELHIDSTASGNTLKGLLKLETDGQSDGSGITIDTRTAHTKGQIDFLDGTGSFDGNYVFKLAQGSALATPTEILRITPSGLAIGGTGTANTLDDYEEGTFTPTFLGSSGDPTVSFNTQSGHYIKVGNVVHLNLTFFPSAISGGSGNLQIGGLPFVKSNSRNHRACGSIIYDRVRVQSNTTTVTPEISDNVQHMQISEMRQGENETRGFIQVDDLEATTSDNPFIEITITHFTD